MLTLHRAAGAVLVLVSIWICSILIRAIYNLYFHPLAKFPGPRLWIAFPIVKSIAQVRGQLDIQTRDRAERYAGVMRTGPDELIFTSAQAWKDIYGHGHVELPKPYSKGIGTGGGVSNIIHANAQDHARFRRAMLPAFSDRALEQQEPVIREYVDLLISRLGEVSAQDRSTDMVKWYTFTTFDLIGDLAYGQSFEGLSSGRSNHWVSSIENMMKLFPILVLASASLVLSKILLFFASDKIKQSRSEHLRLTTELAMQRIQNTSQADRGDFMDYMMKSRSGKQDLSDAELVANSDTLIVAGSETTATVLCGVTFHLLNEPKALQRCVNEVRSAFDTDGAIDIKAAGTKLPYMLACLQEGMRLYPPVPTVLPRQTLPAQITVIDGYSIPEKITVGVHHLATYHSQRNFHNPRSFCPDRWLPQAQTDPNSPYFHDKREAFKPFSSGPRDCIGRNLAFGEMRLILAKVLWNFDLSLMERCKQWADQQRTFALWEKPPLMVEIKSRAA